jgi:glycosyltransferase involved in cell wall biosynthesis
MSSVPPPIDAMSDNDTIHHFGPDPAYVGGIGSVIRVLAEHSMGGERVEMHPTWQPDAHVETLRLAALSLALIMRMRKTELVHVHLSYGGSFIREGALVALARRRGIPVVLTIHGSSFLAFAKRRRSLVTRVLNQADYIICLDDDVLEFVTRAAPTVESRIVANPVAMAVDPSGAGQSEEIVLFAGEIGLRKGVDVLVAAWPMVAAQRPDARCLVVGPVGDYQMSPIERLEVRAPASPAEIRELLREARVVVLPSRAEGMPMILTEAMSAGRPFVSTPVGAIPELAREGGQLVAVGDQVALADAVTELLADRSLAERLGWQGHAFCSATRSVEVIDAQLREIYSFAARRKAGR